jgi:hypothetical protein
MRIIAQSNREVAHGQRRAARRIQHSRRGTEVSAREISRSAEFLVNLRRHPSGSKRYLRSVHKFAVSVQLKRKRTWIVLEGPHNSRILSGIERHGFFLRKGPLNGSGFGLSNCGIDVAPSTIFQPLKMAGNRLRMITKAYCHSDPPQPNDSASYLCGRSVRLQGELARLENPNGDCPPCT